VLYLIFTILLFILNEDKKSDKPKGKTVILFILFITSEHYNMHDIITNKTFLCKKKLGAARL